MRWIREEHAPREDLVPARATPELASRVSINLEAPNSQRLEDLAPKKNYYNELLQPIKWADHIRREKSPQHTWNGRWASTVTQFVVGAVGETDLELIDTDGTVLVSGMACAYLDLDEALEGPLVT